MTDAQARPRRTRRNSLRVGFRPPSIWVDPVRHKHSTTSALGAWGGSGGSERSRRARRQRRSTEDDDLSGSGEGGMWQVKGQRAFQ